MTLPSSGVTIRGRGHSAHPGSTQWEMTLCTRKNEGREKEKKKGEKKRMRERDKQEGKGERKKEKKREK